MKKHALLVGVEEYRDQMISRLRFARADADALAERLCDRCGFDQVRVLADDSGPNEPLLVNIVTVLRDISSELQPEDLFLFFFAGHGIEKDGHGYLLARDSLQAFPEHGSLSLELLRKNFERLAASKRILLLDACRNSPDTGRADAANCMSDVISRDIVAAARSKSAAGTTTALLSACRSGQRAYEWPAKGHGVFTQWILEGLDSIAWRDKQLDFKQLATFVSQQVRKWSASTPGIQSSQEPWYEEFGDPCPLIIGDGISLAGKTARKKSKLNTLGSSAEAIAKVQAQSGHAKMQATDESNAPRRRPVAATADSRFTCPVCGDPSDAGAGDFCNKCGKFVHRACQKCIKTKSAWDWGAFGLDGLILGSRDTISSFACPICATIVRKHRC